MNLQTSVTNYKTAIIDNTPPVVSDCPEDINVDTTIDGAAVTVTWTEPTASDDSGSVSSTSSSAPGDDFPVGTTEVTYTFTDDAGNSAVCTFSVTVAGMGLRLPKLCSHPAKIINSGN